MRYLFPLENPVRHYAWGSPDWLPELLGKTNPKHQPWAELWLGANPAAPSRLPEDPDSSLDRLIAASPDRLLGAAAAGEFGALPYLLKLLAAERPLSIQAHPSLAQAASGFDRENAAGIPLDAWKRNYRDRNHKPEILCALTPFQAMCGFRTPQAIAAALDGLADSVLGPGLASLAVADPEAALRGFFGALFDLDLRGRRALADAVRNQAPRRAANGTAAAAWHLAGRLASEYPEDPAVVSPLYLNLVDLAAGEAIFLPAGVLHSYIHGFGVELMANSDNVLRGGLTSKHLDIGELTSVLRFEPFRPKTLSPTPISAGTAVFAAPCREFQLYRLAGPVAELPAGTPLVIILTEGTAVIEDGAGDSKRCKCGDSLFIAAAAPAPVCRGDFTAYAAGTGLR